MTWTLLGKQGKWYTRNPVRQTKVQFTLSIGVNTVMSLAASSDVTLIKLPRFLNKPSELLEKWVATLLDQIWRKRWYWRSKWIIDARCKRAFKFVQGCAINALGIQIYWSSIHKEHHSSTDTRLRSRSRRPDLLSVPHSEPKSNISRSDWLPVEFSAFHI